jgi:hypothetical protein
LAYSALFYNLKLLNTTSSVAPVFAAMAAQSEADVLVDVPQGGPGVTDQSHPCETANRRVMRSVRFLRKLTLKFFDIILYRFGQ